MANIKAWITVNGRHIPIMEGESKATALANHFKKIKEKSSKKEPEISEFYKDRLNRIDAEIREKQKIASLSNSDSAVVRKKAENAKKRIDELQNQYNKLEDVAKADARGYQDKKIIAGRQKTKNELVDENVKLYKENSGFARTDKKEVQDAHEKWLENSKKIKASDKYKLKEDKSITTPSGKYTAKELEKRDAGIKNMYKDAWNGKKSYTELNNDLEKMVKEGKVSRGELDSLKNIASREHDQAKVSTSEKRKITGVKKTNDTRKDFDGNEERKTETWGNQKYSTKEVRGKLRGMKVHDEERFGNAFIVTKTYDGLYGVRGIGDKSDAMTDYNAWTYGFREKWIIEDLGRRGYISNNSIKTSTRAKTYKDTTGKASKLVVKNAYERYMKEHPNSTMKLSAFEKTYKKK